MIKRHVTIPAKYAVIWINHDCKQVWVTDCRKGWLRSDGWVDPLGASYTAWIEARNSNRIERMKELALYLGALGFNMRDVLIEFARVKEFFALGRDNEMMCVALTKALTGRELSAVTMDFDQLFEEYGAGIPKRIERHEQRIVSGLDADTCWAVN